MNLEDKFLSAIEKAEFIVDELELMMVVLNERSRKKVYSIKLDVEIIANELRSIKNSQTEQKLKIEVD